MSALPSDVRTYDSYDAAANTLFYYISKVVPNCLLTNLQRVELYAEAMLWILLP